MSRDEVTIKSISALRVAEMTGIAEGLEPRFIGPVVGGLYDKLSTALRQTGITPVGPATVYYEKAEDEVSVIVHAGLPVSVEPDPAFGFAVVDLLEIEQAATIVHRGPMSECLATYHALAHWIAEADYRSVGLSREVTLTFPEDPNDMITELQQPIVRV